MARSSGAPFGVEAQQQIALDARQTESRARDELRALEDSARCGSSRTIS
ncbi:MAG: hypothetical protein U1E04_15925 [Hylemonella sp.]|nr:hypothetical protein [Hylemonella sp.]